MSIIAAYNEAWDYGDVDALTNIITMIAFSTRTSAESP